MPEYCTKTVTVADKHREYEIIKDITYYFIELPKFRKERPRLANKLECWLALIDGKGELIEMAKEKDKIIKEAVEELEELLANEEVRDLYEYRLSAQLEENSRLNYAQKEGLRRRNGKTEWKNGMQKRNAKAEEKKKKWKKIEKVVDMHAFLWYSNQAVRKNCFSERHNLAVFQKNKNSC